MSDDAEGSTEAIVIKSRADEHPKVTLTVTHRHVQRRWTNDGWWEHLERNPETGVETWVRYKPMHPVEIAMRDQGLQPNLGDEHKVIWQEDKPL